jgi:hypothetical protein
VRWHCPRCAGRHRPRWRSVRVVTPSWSPRATTEQTWEDEVLWRGHHGGEPSNVASPVFGWFHGGDGEVEGVVVELCTIGIGKRHDDGGS